jgi:hypothetical protein
MWGCFPKTSRIGFNRMSSNYKNEEWLSIYHIALLELHHAKMTGRIGDARTSIALRLEKLKTMPGLHAEERRSLDDASRTLELLDDEEMRYQTEERVIAGRALENLRKMNPE